MGIGLAWKTRYVKTKIIGKGVNAMRGFDLLMSDFNLTEEEESFFTTFGNRFFDHERKRREEKRKKTDNVPNVQSIIVVRDGGFC
jgi:hypothetical protein